MASCCRTAELPARFLSFSAVRFASRRGVEAVPQPTAGKEKGTNTEQYQPTIYCLLHAISLTPLRLLALGTRHPRTLRILVLLRLPVVVVVVVAPQAARSVDVNMPHNSHRGWQPSPPRQTRLAIRLLRQIG